MTPAGVPVRRTRTVGRTPPVRRTAETELAAPVGALLESLGFTVRSEVRGCDLVARRGDEVLVVEMKTKPGLTLLVQAARRQALADSVYVAVPEPAPRDRAARRAWLGFRLLLRRLGIGLFTVRLGDAPRAMLVDDPAQRPVRRETERRTRLLAEWRGRSGDDNTAGSTRRVVMTAYREAALYVACCLEHFGEKSPKELVALGAGRAAAILQRNYYGWFERTAPGRYRLTEAGRHALGDFAGTSARCRQQLEARLPDLPSAEHPALPAKGQAGAAAGKRTRTPVPRTTTAAPRERSPRSRRKPPRGD